MWDSEVWEKLGYGIAAVATGGIGAAVSRKALKSEAERRLTEVERMVNQTDAQVNDLMMRFDRLDINRATERREIREKLEAIHESVAEAVQMISVGRG